MTSTAVGSITTVGSLPTGYRPKRKIVIGFFNGGVHIGTMHFSLNGDIVIMSAVQGILISNHVEIGCAYYV